MSGLFTVLGYMIGAACGMVIGNGLVNIINERLIRRIVREEIDAEYFDIACKRIEDAQRQGDMFMGAAA